MIVAVLDDYQGVAVRMADWTSLPKGTEVQFFLDHLADEDALADRLSEFQVVAGMRERTPFPRSLLTRLPDLRLLVTTGRRNASFDTQAATELGIVVCGTGGAGEGPAELTWGLIIGLLRHIPLEDQRTRQGNWGTIIGVGLQGKTLGLLGLGHIGSLVARVGNAFDMNVIAWSQNLTAERTAECGVTLVDKDTLFRESDIVSIHVVLSDRTRGLVGAHELGLMKPDSYLVNTSRGPIVDEAALVDLLQREAIAGAALDTFDVEPLPPAHPFLALHNTVLAPHNGYVTEEAYQAFYSGIVEDITAFAGGEPVRVLNPEVLTSPQLRGAG
ncbi:MAG: D-2-hydroxyacid dehydrogenase family protein [Dehalococcoidia bacterium]|nr:D-2-hydroxyacid dehydrogenase family protein [Dehalococcoidia bacterium]